MSESKLHERLQEKIRKAPWNKGKRKPITDDMGKKWCACEDPNLVSAGDGVHQAYCLKCGEYWYH